MGHQGVKVQLKGCFHVGHKGRTVRTWGERSKFVSTNEHMNSHDGRRGASGRPNSPKTQGEETQAYILPFREYVVKELGGLTSYLKEMALEMQKASSCRAMTRQLFDTIRSEEYSGRDARPTILSVSIVGLA